MNINKFTQKSIQAVNDLEKIAYEYGNQEIEQEHLLYALLNQEDSLILKLIEKMEINKEDDTNIGCDVLYILMNPTTYSIIICLYLVPPASGNISSNHSSQSRHCTP